jgi:hypothetical protein
MQLDELRCLDITFDLATPDDESLHRNDALDRRLVPDDQQAVTINLACELAVDPGSALEKELPFVSGSGAQKHVDD